MAYGGDRPIAVLRTAVPGLKTMSRASLKGCLLRYIAYGWTGAMPEECRSSVVYAPINVAPWLWGWSNRFLNRMESAASTVFASVPITVGISRLGWTPTKIFLASPALQRRHNDKRARTSGFLGRFTTVTAPLDHRPGSRHIIEAPLLI